MYIIFCLKLAYCILISKYLGIFFFFLFLNNSKNKKSWLDLMNLLQAEPAGIKTPEVGTSAELGTKLKCISNKKYPNPFHLIQQ